MAKKRKRGRPSTGGAHPVRILGRIPDDQWAQLKAAAERTGKPFSRWAVEVLLRAAARSKS